MRNLEKNKQALELSKQFVLEWFKKLRKDNPEYYNSLQDVMFWKNVPSFLLKYFQRTKDRLDVDMSMQEVMEKTWLNKGQVNYLFRKWYTLSDMLNMH